MLLFIVYFAFSYFTTAAPVGGPSAPAYVPGPSGRGTVSLVTNCVVTLSLCVWTAVHLNVFPPGTTLRKRVLYQLGWAMLGMFAPEVVLWRAITQWRVARTVCRRRNELMNKAVSIEPAEFSELKLPRPGRVSKPWDLEHGFLLVMGGMGVTLIDEEDQSILEDGNTLTPFGALTLAKVGALPDIGREKITARSKADSLGKTLVCIQAIWMVIQTVARKIAGLPTTLLELNTLAHVVCAILMYLIWWRKPQNVNDVLEFPISRDLAFFMKPAPEESSWRPSYEWRERSLDDPKYKLEEGVIRDPGKFQVVGQIKSEWSSFLLDLSNRIRGILEIS
jgi:hypothetical protein